MRIGFVTQWYPPEQGTALSSSIASSLVSLGHTVDVVTGFPNYPTGRLYEGYSVRPYRRENVSPGLTVHRAPLYPSHDRSASRRILNYASFSLAAIPVALAAVPKPDVWLVYSSPATAALPVMLRRQNRAPYALLLQDLWPESVTHSNFVGSTRIQGMMETVLDQFCALSYRRARRIGVISPSMRDVLIERGVPAGKIRYTPNWAVGAPADVGEQSGVAERRALGLPPEGIIFLYAGNLGQLQGLEQLVQNFPEDPSVQLVLMGAGVLRGRLRDLADRRPNVHLRDPVPTEEVGRYLRCADALVVSLSDDPLLRVTMPSKMQASLAAGRPTLVHGAGDVVDVVTSAGAGAAATPGDREALRSAVAEIAGLTSDGRRVMGQRARSRYVHEFDQRIGAARIAAMLEEAAEKEVHTL